MSHIPYSICSIRYVGSRIIVSHLSVSAIVRQPHRHHVSYAMLLHALSIFLTHINIRMQLGSESKSYIRTRISSKKILKQNTEERTTIFLYWNLKLGRRSFPEVLAVLLIKINLRNIIGMIYSVGIIIIIINGATATQSASVQLHHRRRTHQIHSVLFAKIFRPQQYTVYISYI